MFALGCIQSQNCHTDRCPTGVATQDAARLEQARRAGQVDARGEFPRDTLIALKELVQATGLTHPEQIGRST